jgi:hypothetical protein
MNLYLLLLVQNFTHIVILVMPMTDNVIFLSNCTASFKTVKLDKLFPLKMSVQDKPIIEIF